MARTTVGVLLDNVKRVLQEALGEDGVRWTNAELVAWLNEAYQALVKIKPDASSVVADMRLDPGTRQAIPSDGLRLLDVVRNTANESEGMGIMVTSRRSLDMMRRGWHRDPKTLDIEQFVFDDMAPAQFYVYPPAQDGARVELIYSAVPHHDEGSGIDKLRDEAIKVNDAYAPILTDYVLYRAFSKDAEGGVNQQRAQLHQNAYLKALGQKVQTDRGVSPNARPTEQG